MTKIDTSNQAKYMDAESNFVIRALIGWLFRSVAATISSFAPQSVLDAGCGEGHALDFLSSYAHYVGIDVNPDCVNFCREKYPARQFAVESVLALPFADQGFDVVLCMEVLEHLEHPTEAVRELTRVAKHGIVLTVPFEPVFQAGNALRGKYLATFGNHPEHIQHWGPRSFARFLKATNALRDVKVKIAGTWLMASARPAR
jgi:ubiquinone/menaquinone biosynthesis C-methylase UbiE